MQDDKPRAKRGVSCPFWRKDVSKVCHTCMLWTGLQWEDPKTKMVQSKWSCAIVMAALTNVDVVKATAGTQMATESFRNEMVVRSGIAPLGAMTELGNDTPRMPDSLNGHIPKLIGQS